MRFLAGVNLVFDATTGKLLGEANYTLDSAAGTQVMSKEGRILGTVKLGTKLTDTMSVTALYSNGKFSAELCKEDPAFGVRVIYDPSGKIVANVAVQKDVLRGGVSARLLYDSTGQLLATIQYKSASGDQYVIVDNRNGATNWQIGFARGGLKGRFLMNSAGQLVGSIDYTNTKWNMQLKYVDGKIDASASVNLGSVAAKVVLDSAGSIRGYLTMDRVGSAQVMYDMRTGQAIAQVQVQSGGLDAELVYQNGRLIGTAGYTIDGWMKASVVFWPSGRIGGEVDMTRGGWTAQAKLNEDGSFSFSGSFKSETKLLM